MLPKSKKLGKLFLIAVKSNKSRLTATGCAEQVRASLSLSNDSPFPLTSEIMKIINQNLIFSSIIKFTNKASLSTSHFPYTLVKISIVLQKTAEWSPLIKLSNLFKFLYSSHLFEHVCSLCVYLKLQSKFLRICLTLMMQQA